MTTIMDQTKHVKKQILNIVQEARHIITYIMLVLTYRFTCILVILVNYTYNVIVVSYECQ